MRSSCCRWSRLIAPVVLALVAFASDGIGAQTVPIVDGKPTDFLVQKWTTENGLPQNTVTSLVQTRDGYLWVGTFGGLARFDGISFTIFDASNSPTLKSNRILSLFEDSHQTLWIGAETGEIYFLKDFRFRELTVPTELQRSTVWAFEEDGDGGLFIVSNSGLEKVRLDERGEVVQGSHIVLSTRASSRLVKDPTGNIWAKVGSEIFVIENDHLIPSHERGIDFPESPLQMAFAPDGRAFTASYGALGLVGPNEYSEFLKLRYDTHRSGFSVNSHHGKFWFQQAGDLYTFSEDGGTRYDLGNYVDGGSRVLMFDDEGNLWIGTNYSGLVRVTRREIELLSDVTGNSLDGVFSLAQNAEGAVFLAAGERGLFRFQNGMLRKVEGLGGPGRLPVVRSVAVDGNNATWVGGTSGLYCLKEREIIPIPALAGKHIHALFFDALNRLWIGMTDGVGVLANGQYTPYTTANGLPGNSVHFIMQSRDNAIWIGTMGGVSVLRDGQFQNITTEDGLSAAYVRDIVEDDDGTMWFATYGGGITRYRSGQISTIRRGDGLPNNFVSRILAGDASRYWILTNVGIFAVDRDAMNDVADHRIAVLAGSLFDTSDGMPSSEANGGHQPAGIRTRDGKLWFPMLKDVIIIDPTPTDSLPPKVVIERATSKLDSSSERPPGPLFDSRKVLQIKDGFRNLEIGYTGLSFGKPDELRFFYRLDGFDKDWVDAGFRRTAFYPYLPAGSYTFEVKALGPNGKWSVGTAEMTIIVAQQFWETRWFTFVMVVFVAGVVAFFYRSRALIRKEREHRQHEFSRRLMDAQEKERERMAAELHDGLGQNLLLIKNWALLAVSDSKGPEEAAEYLYKISDTATNSLEEAREIVHNLSPQVLKRFGLTEGIQNNVDHIRDATGVVIETSIEDIDGIFPEESEIYVYRMVQECLNNIVRHSDSPRGALDIRCKSGTVRISVKDFGRGFDMEEVLVRPYHTGIGLHTIAQRVRFMGGELSIDSRIGHGTRIVIKLDAGKANKDNQDTHR